MKPWLASLFVLLLPAHLLAADDKSQAILKLFVEEFVPITPGKGKFPASFKMGGDTANEEKPVHEVKPAASFSMAKYEVTQELYQAVMGINPSKWKGPRNSVEMTSWKDANEFCRKATVALRKHKLIGEDQEVRLPSEAEWEYCCRAGTTTPFSFENEKDIKDYCWYNGNSKGEDPPVGKKKSNAWGLYDMHGYIWEWCADAWQADYKGAPADGSPRTAAEVKQAVARGGSWNDPSDRCRSAARTGFKVDELSDTIGFRCVLAKAK